MIVSSSLAANMLTKQTKEGNRDQTNHSLRSQAAAHHTNAKEGNIDTDSHSTVDTDHKHQRVWRTQKEYSTEPMLSQMNTLMSHAASQRKFYIHIRRKLFSHLSVERAEVEVMIYSTGWKAKYNLTAAEAGKIPATKFYPINVMQVNYLIHDIHIIFMLILYYFHIILHYIHASILPDDNLYMNIHSIYTVSMMSL